MIISRNKYTDMVIEIRNLNKYNKQLQLERDHYKRVWQDLQRFCMNFAKDKGIDFPATTKIEPENKLF